MLQKVLIIITILLLLDVASESLRLVLEANKDAHVIYYLFANILVLDTSQIPNIYTSSLYYIL